MRTSRQAAIGVAAVLLAAMPAYAQQPGTVELGGFASYTRFGSEIAAEDRGGAGGRIGIFVTPRISLEGEAGYSYTNFLGGDGGKIWYSPLTLRAIYNLPIAGRSALLLGAGVTRSHFYYADESYDAGPSVLAGLRLGVARWLALRVDGTAAWMLDPSTVNLEGRAGASILFRVPHAEPGAEASLATSPSAGTIDLDVFGQYSVLDDTLGGDDGIGVGGRVGIFVTPRLAVEAELSTTTVDSAGGSGDFRYAPLALRAVLHKPVARRLALLAGVGAVRSDYYSLWDYGVSGLLGFRVPLSEHVGLRVDGTADYLPDPKATNFGARAGLSVRFRPWKPAPAPVVVQPDAVTQPEPEPAAPMVDSAAIRDSLARVAARMRADSIAAENELRRMTEEARNTLRARIHFGFDEEALTPASRATLDAKLPLLRANPAMRIRVVGHADERGSDEYNLALGQRRAAAAKRYLVQRGIRATRIETLSRGEEEPVCRDGRESCWSQNRRDEFLILVGEDRIVLPR
jgi:peptidoglycan-associated lipoprotein